MTAHFPFDNSYAKLPEAFYARVAPTSVAAPSLVKINRALALELGLDPDALATPEGVEILAGKRVADGSDPIAAAYAGHQFGQFVPQLGDGRAILLGEVIDRSGIRRDIQLKGSGPTPFSRRGDGRAALGPVLREYLVSESMAALGIPTTRALAAVTTGENIYRETILPGAVLTRVASSHIRVGTYQFFASRRDYDSLRHLADYTIARHYPDIAAGPNPYCALLDRVIGRQAELVARWMLVGFIHGVMNTDNMSVCGETIDYGPCAFMDAYHPGTVFSSIDYASRYAYSNQSGVAHWNLARLAECLMPLMSEDKDEALKQANEVLSTFRDRFNAAYYAGLRQKFGFATEQDGDKELMQALLDRMAMNKADFTLTFRRLCDAAASADADQAVGALFENASAFDDWAVHWRQRLEKEAPDASARRDAMRRVNPAFIPRNHRVEAVIEAALSSRDFAPFEELLKVLATPYDDQPGFAHYADPPPSNLGAYQTFCGT